MIPEIVDHVIALVLYAFALYVATIIGYENKNDVITHDGGPLKALGSLSALIAICWVLLRIIFNMTIAFVVMLPLTLTIWLIIFAAWSIHESRAPNKSDTIGYLLILLYLLVTVMGVASAARIVILVTS